MRAFVARSLASSLGGASSPAYKETSRAAGHGADQDSTHPCEARADENAHVFKRACMQVASGESELHALSHTFPETHDEDQILVSSSEENTFLMKAEVTQYMTLLSYTIIINTCNDDKYTYYNNLMCGTLLYQDDVICRYVQFENIAIVHHCLGLLKEGEPCSNLECDALSELDCFFVELPLDVELQEHFKGNNYVCNYR